MAKTDFTKAEEVIGETLNKIKVENLLELADKQSGVPHLKTMTDIPSLEIRNAIVNSLKCQLKWLHHENSNLYKDLKVSKKELFDLFKKLETIDIKDWKKIEEVRKKVTVYHTEHHKSPPTDSNDNLVEKERVKHINKRFNGNDKWLLLR